MNFIYFSIQIYSMNFSIPICNFSFIRVYIKINIYLQVREVRAYYISRNKDPYISLLNTYFFRSRSRFYVLFFCIIIRYEFYILFYTTLYNFYFIRICIKINIYLKFMDKWRVVEHIYEWIFTRNQSHPSFS